MIVSVTVNPSIDKTARLNRLQPGALNRLNNVLSDAGGKGINVSKTLAVSLGCPSTAMGIAGANNSRQFFELLGPYDFSLDFIEIKGASTRTNLKIIDDENSLTEFNEPGISVSSSDLDLLLKKLLVLAGPSALFSLSGSLPQNCPPDYYATLTAKLKQAGAKVFVDADGEALALALEQSPDFIKPNRYELLRYFSAPESASDAELVAMCRELRRRGVSIVALSMGPRGAMFFSDSGDFFASAVDVMVRSTVGAGDAMVAALCYGFDRDLPLQQTFKLAMAVSAGAASTDGTNPPSEKFVGQLIEKAALVSLD